MLRIAVIQTVLFSAGVLLFAGDAGAQVRSIESFVHMKPQWEAMQGVQMKLEGRYTSVGKNLLRFRNCDLAFQSEADFQKLTGQSKTVEVTGSLTKKNGRLVFVVERLRELPNDLETLRNRQSQIHGESEAPWYALAKWAMGRGSFYHDEELIAAARSAYEKGMGVEYRRLAGQDPEELLKLAEKGKQFGISESFQQDLVHEAYWQLWNEEREKGSEKLAVLASRVASGLQASRQPLLPPQPKLADRYKDHPLEEYRESDQTQRLKLHRILYSEIMLSVILSSARPDGQNGFDIAAKIDEQLPEFKDLAESYRDRQLQYELAHVATATRSEAIALSERFRRRRQPDRARQTLHDWLQSREKRLWQDGVGGLLQLADEYLNLLEDEPAATALLMEANKLKPELADVSDRLVRLGYRMENGQWLKGGEQPARPPDPVQSAIRDGRVIPDMTRADVRQTLGDPTSIARMASAGRIAEAWLYGEPGTSRLVIHFLRRPRQKESRVVDVVQLPR